ncbi:MAG: deoxyribonuclease IV [Patescibacteria group bacterium]|nr:MAG: deoxyribonuclease IV [Patescibacteria group bacterium]
MPVRIGAHVSIAGSLDLAIDRAVEIGAECIQIFGSAPQSWQSFIFPLEQVDKFQKKREEQGISPVFLHAIYLINLASSNSRILGNSLTSLIQYLKFGRVIGAEGVIFHMGSHKGRGFEAVAGQLVEAVSQVLSRTRESGRLIIENSAGAGGVVGASFREIGLVVKAVRDPRVAVCLDTAHAFESGYDLRTKKGLEQALDEFDREVGLEKLVAVHANDSRTSLGSHRDRHENIGDGEIGLRGFKGIISHPDLRDLPFILETPGFGRHGVGRKNIETLRGLAGSG